MLNSSLSEGLCEAVAFTVLFFAESKDEAF
jgi:hypothetical protein